MNRTNSPSLAVAALTAMAAIISAAAPSEAIAQQAAGAIAQDAALDAAQKATEGAPEKADESSSPSFWMNRKMKLSKDLLASLVAGDSQKISDTARSLRMLNRIEAFSRRSTPGYREQLRNFEEALDEIVLQAEKDNVEGASLGFTQLTISCVNCHKKLRASE